MSRPQRSLGLQMAAILFAGLLLATVLISALQTWLAWHHARERALERIGEIERSHLASLTHSLWSIDEQRIAVMLDGLIQLPDVGAVTLIDASGQRWHRQRAEAGERIVRRRLPIHYQ